MKKPRTALQAGQHVEVRDETWAVVTIEPFETVAVVTLRGVARGNHGETCRLLTPFDIIRPMAIRSKLAPSCRTAVLACAAHAIATSPPWASCWTAGTARIDLRRWQLEPALAAIAGASRILLADEAGLGKTIQAALIVSELAARGLAERVLILTPPSLRTQWADELANRFHIIATVFDQAALAATTAALPVGVNPWRIAPVIIASIDLVKRPEFRTALDDVPLDILVVDEAHHVTPGTDRAAVVADLASRTPRVVLATATPHSGDDVAYRFLCDLGAGQKKEPLITFRRGPAQLRETRPKRTHLLAVTPTNEERLLLESSLAYSHALWRRETVNPGVGLVASVIARRAASSASAAERTLERRLVLLQSLSLPIAQARLPWDEGDDDDEVSDERLGIAGLASEEEEIAYLRRLIELARAAKPASSKIRAIRRLLRRTSEHVLIFSEYRDVVQEVAVRLADLASVELVHGGVVAHARRERLRSFTEGRTRVLVTTDAAGEGLNLQSRCRILINLELPWNPLRLDQRVGRLDRIGQSRRVHAIHLCHRGSYEDVVLAHLERRRRRVAEATHETVSRITNDDVATERRLRDLVRHRRDLPLRPRSLFAPEGPQGQPASSVILFFGAEIIDAAGRLVQRQVIPLRIALSAHRLPSQELPRMFVQHLVHDEKVRAVADQDLRAHLARAQSACTPVAIALEQRLEDLMSGIAARQAHRLFQGSLFDRRGEQHAQARAATVLTWRRHFTKRQEMARALLSLRATTPHLIAAWLTE
jgi:superfamily II DNA or RNA helicase